MNLKLKELVLLSLLGAVLFVLKMAMAPLPNIEPVSLVVMVLAVTFGWKGLLAVYVYVFLELLVWGIGPWSICYLYVWTFLFACVRSIRSSSSLPYALLSGCFGFLFGALCALAYIPIGGALAWWLAGLPMDLVHGFSNFLIALFLFGPLRHLFARLAGPAGSAGHRV